MAWSAISETSLFRFLRDRNFGKASTVRFLSESMPQKIFTAKPNGDSRLLQPAMVGVYRTLF